MPGKINKWMLVHKGWYAGWIEERGRGSHQLVILLLTPEGVGARHLAGRGDQLPGISLQLRVG